MTNRERYKRTFSALQASKFLLTEEKEMKMNRKKRTYIPRVAVALLPLLLIVGSGTVAYANDLGGIQRTVQLWIHGDQTTAVFDMKDGTYHATYQNKDGETVETGGGGVAIEEDGTERPVTEEELIAHLNRPETEVREDGSVWLYYYDQEMEITDLFNEDGVCFVLLKHENEIMYVTIKGNGGYACSPNAYVQPWQFETQP